MEDADYSMPTLSLPHQGGGNCGLFTQPSPLDHGKFSALCALRFTDWPGGHHPLDFSPLMGYFL
jgi:hypothetical protein